MAEVWLRLAGVACSVCGMVWLALAMKTHWLQVQRSRTMPAHAARTLRTLGALALASSLALALRADHGTIAPLVWVMTMTASALLVAFTLATKPHWLSAFVPFLR